jgi:hypothetical protein
VLSEDIIAGAFVVRCEKRLGKNLCRHRFMISKSGNPEKVKYSVGKRIFS